jgi:hypothetical protein
MVDCISIHEKEMTKVWLIENWGELTLAALTFVKVVVELTSNKRDNKVFGLVDDFIRSLIPQSITRRRKR